MGAWVEKVGGGPFVSAQDRFALTGFLRDWAPASAGALTVVAWAHRANVALSPGQSRHAISQGKLRARRAGPAWRGELRPSTDPDPPGQGREQASPGLRPASRPGLRLRPGFAEQSFPTAGPTHLHLPPMAIDFRAPSRPLGFSVHGRKRERGDYGREERARGLRSLHGMHLSLLPTQE